MANRLGWQTQHGGPVALSMLRAAPPGVLKLLGPGALDPGLAAEWRRLVGPDGILVYRRVYPPGADLSRMAARTAETIADGRRLADAGPVALEVPYNEEDANGPALGDLAGASVAAVDAVTAAGFDAVWLVLPEGNPADPRDLLQPRVLAAIRRARAIAAGRGRRLYFGFHGYTTPRLGPVDPDHLLRYRELLDLLPADCRCPVLLGESGIDGGIEQRGSYGFRAYGLSPGTYAREYLTPLRDAVQADPDVAGVAVFGVAMNDDWSTYDLGDSVDARPVFAADRPLWRPPTPTETPMPDNRPTLVAMWRQGDDLTPDEQGPAGLIAALAAGGFTAAVADVYQGTVLQGRFSRTAVDVPAVDAAVALARTLRAAGLRFWPMVNPFGQDPELEASLHAAVANAIAGATGEPCPLFVDLEALYPGFFGVSIDGVRYFPPEELSARIRRYFAALQPAMGINPVVVVPDPRQIGREYGVGDLPAHAPLWLQTYDKDFQLPWREVFARHVPGAADLAPHVVPDPDAASGYGGRPASAMVQGDDPTLTMGAIADWCAGRQSHLCVWGFGSLVGTPDATDVDDFSTFAAAAGPYRPVGGVGVAPGQPPTGATWPNGRRVAPTAEYDEHVWAPELDAYGRVMAAAAALRDGGNGDLGDDAAAAALEAIGAELLAAKAASERLHGVTR